VLMATCALTLLPGMVIAQIDNGLLQYFRQSLQLSRQEAARTTSSRVRFVIDPSQPLLTGISTPAALPRLESMCAGVPSLTPELRRRAEADLRLPRSVSTDGCKPTGVMRSMTRRRTHLGRIVADPRVRDTDGIDRGRFFLTTPPPPPPGWTAELRRWQIAPGIFQIRERVAVGCTWVAWVVVFYAAFCALRPGQYDAMAAPEIALPEFRAVCPAGRHSPHRAVADVRIRRGSRTSPFR
jgi:hypothetical protein